MNVSLIFLLVGFSYIVLTGGLALLRHEGLSLRFAVEGVAVTLVASGLAALSVVPANPVLFLIVLYLITMRIRLLVDLANIFAKQGRHTQAGRLYVFASRLWPDAAANLILKVNQATLLLQENKLDESISLLGEVLGNSGRSYLGMKYEAAAHYNLGVAYLRKNMDARATVEFNAAIDAWPMSVYARHAEAALEKRRKS